MQVPAARLRGHAATGAGVPTECAQDSQLGLSFGFVGSWLLIMGLIKGVSGMCN